MAGLNEVFFEVFAVQFSRRLASLREAIDYFCPPARISRDVSKPRILAFATSFR